MLEILIFLLLAVLVIAGLPFGLMFAWMVIMVVLAGALAVCVLLVNLAHKAH